jgi:hypothetical protein
LVDAVAKAVTGVEANLNEGYFIQDFPRNPIQAARYFAQRINLFLDLTLFWMELIWL